MLMHFFSPKKEMKPGAASWCNYVEQFSNHPGYNTSPWSAFSVNKTFRFNSFLLDRWLSLPQDHHCGVQAIPG